MTKNGADLSEMLRVLPATEEYTSRFTNMTPDQVITTIYMSLFGREPDPEGLAFFKEQLASGAQNMATIAVNILQGAQGDDKADIEAKVEAAELFTASLDTEAEIQAYKGADAAALAKKFIDTVDKDNKPTADAVEKAADAVAAGQDPTGGQAPGGGGGGGGSGTVTPPPTPLQIAQAEAKAIGEKWSEYNDEFYHLRTYDGGPEAVSGAYSSTLAVESNFGETLGSAAKALNIAVIELGIKYALLIEQFPSVALTDIFSFDIPGRQQTVHDNLLGNINAAAINARGLLTQFQDALNDIAGGAYAERPWFGGYDSDIGKAAHDAVRAFDWTRGIERADDWIDTLKGSVDPAGIQPDGNLYFGGGNPPTNFNIVRHEGAGLELGLKAKFRGGEGPTYISNTSDGDVAIFNVDPGYQSPSWGSAANWSFDYSIVSGLNGRDADVIANYDVKLRIDIDSSEDVKWLEFTLVGAGNTAYWEAESGYKMGGDGRGNDYIDQNSFNIGFAGIIAEINGVQENPYNFGAGQFDVQLEASQNGTQIAANTIRVIVGDLE